MCAAPTAPAPPKSEPATNSFTAEDPLPDDPRDALAKTTRAERTKLAQVRYQRAVFFVRLLGFITPPPVRRISYPDSLRFEAIHEAVYREHGFHLVEIPAATIDHRAAAIDSYIRSQAGSSPGQGAHCCAN